MKTLPFRLSRAAGRFCPPDQLCSVAMTDPALAAAAAARVAAEKNGEFRSAELFPVEESFGLPMGGRETQI